MQRIGHRMEVRSLWGNLNLNCIEVLGSTWEYLDVLREAHQAALTLYEQVDEEDDFQVPTYSILYVPGQ